MSGEARQYPRGGRIRWLAFLLALGILGPAGSAAASTITVDSTADSAPSASACVLRDAITAANQGLAVNGCAAGGSVGTTDVIQFAAGVSGTISLESALPGVQTPVNIQGPGAGQLDLHRADAAPAFRILNITGSEGATVSGLTVSNGLVVLAAAPGDTVNAFGGGIRSQGALTLDGVTVKDNRVSASADNAGSAAAKGGGISASGGSSAGALTIVRSKLIGNVATATGNSPDASIEVEAIGAGGGVFAANPSITLDRTTISDNHASGSTTGGESTTSRAVGAGGGLLTGLSTSADHPHVTFDRSTISSNTATFSHPGSSYVLPHDSASGGGVYIGGGPWMSAITGSTIAGNSAVSGGGVFFDVDVNTQGPIVATTVASNSAATGANVDRAGPASVNFSNTIVANPLGGGVNCVAPSIVSLGNNLEGPNPAAAGPSCAFNDQTDLVLVDPQLQPLADNGGPTATMEPLPTSPAVDAGKAFGTTTDQRGEPRPLDLAAVSTSVWSDGTDIGAFELQPAETMRALSVAGGGSGSGSVSSSPAGIDCGATCSASVVYGATITLTATADPGSIFAGWSGGGCTGTAACQVQMDSDKQVTATFVARHSLSVTTGGSGAGSVSSSSPGIDCGQDCVESYDQGTSVTLTASPASGSSFAGWSGGGCAGTGTCEVQMDSDKQVIATFTEDQASQPETNPDTEITKAKVTKAKRKVTFRFQGIDEATGFECELKRGHKDASFQPCTSPKTYKHLKAGSYSFFVRATNATGPDATPAKKRFRI